METIKNNKLAVVALVVALAALLSYYAPKACAQSTVDFNYVAWQTLDNGGPEADNTVRWEYAVPTVKLGTVKLYGMDAEILGELKMKSTGLTNTESSPVQNDFSVEPFIRFGISEGLSLDVGPNHRSNGESGDASTSKNIGFVRANYHLAKGDWTVDATGTGYYIMDAEDLYEFENYGFGDDGRWGLEGAGRIEHAKWGSIGVRKEMMTTFVMVQPSAFTVGELGPMVYGLWGRGLMSEDGTDYGAAVGLGFGTAL